MRSHNGTTWYGMAALPGHYWFDKIQLENYGMDCSLACKHTTAANRRCRFCGYYGKCCPTGKAATGSGHCQAEDVANLNMDAPGWPNDVWRVPFLQKWGVAPQVCVVDGDA